MSRQKTVNPTAVGQQPKPVNPTAVDPQTERMRAELRRQGYEVDDLKADGLREL